MNSCFIAVGPDRAHTGEYLPKILSKSVNICGNSGKITTNFQQKIPQKGRHLAHRGTKTSPEMVKNSVSVT